ncbi:polysaccharide biosynthesis protein [Prochlorococcus marinus]|uniref:polysaccharide biosynthesis protein n=1 Tax=Prochlorococcus marinus TaxID=1219 RepID=UPI001AD9DA3C|nr:nucleoside-diphosphate sugar epimerase/dehydratase [Prochlorococcus marinus]MBO8204935.1 polysaccharide biosynthesis protein [Prochlorococcus marinus CUG1415]
MLTKYFFQTISKDLQILNLTIYILLTIIISSFVYIIGGQYNSITRYIGAKSAFKIILRNLIITLSIYILNLYLKFINNSPSVLLISFGFTTFFLSSYRFLLRDLLFKLNKIINKKIKNVVIYGAGSAGIQLAASLKVSNNYSIISFIDDNTSLQYRKINDIPILSPNVLEQISQKKKVDLILLAIPNLSPFNRKRILNNLNKLNLKVLQIPSLKDLSEGNAKIDSLRSIGIEDLLGRKVVLPKKELLEKTSKNKTIFITGGAGSIGSELCIQLFKYLPKEIIILDSSELNIYNITEKINAIYKDKKICFQIILGDCKDEKLINKIFENNNIDIVFHAAAYKHVPLIEKNPLIGLRNNIISTYIICKAAQKYNLSNMTLISSDKAVRPSNVMGASKRVSELIVQSFAALSNENNEPIQKRKGNTSFSIVRFGNVLNSSGSVVPLFKKQIEDRKDITITDPRIIRYFMTIPEAVELIIQSVSLHQNGDVLLLDMGEPVKIMDVAKQMISLSGLKIKDEKNPYGDIRIKITGLRPGEKLYEELLINNTSLKTEHPLIYRSRESHMEPDELIPLIDELIEYLKELEKEKSLNLLKRIVPEWENHQNLKT